MAKILQTPSVNYIVPFDPSKIKIIEFQYSDNQSVKNRAVIIDKESSEIIYDMTQEVIKTQHEIPADTLTAGRQYLIQIQVFDEDGNSSNLSDAVLFYCFSSPVFKFSNISTGEVHKNVTLVLDLLYEQNESEPLKSFQFIKYAYDKTLLSSSETFYSTSALSYSFYRLNNDTTYYFRAIGETLHGMSLDTGYIEVNISYTLIPSNAVFQASNNYCGGYIQIETNIKDIEYVLENDSYTIENGMLTLKDNSLTYNNGFIANEDFSLYVDVLKVPEGTFLTTNDNLFFLSIVPILGIYYCKLTVKDSNFVQYVALPNATLSTDKNDTYTTKDGKTVTFLNLNSNNTTVTFEVKRKNGYYGLKVYEKS